MLITSFRCEDGESASVVKTCLEREWSNVVKAGQKVKVKMKDDFVDVVEKLLFLAKLSSNGTYYATAKVIVRL